MGWSKGDWVFEPVAEALGQLEADDHTTTMVCQALIKGLLECDWDEPDESLRRHLEKPAIVEAFARCGITMEDDDG